MRASYCKGAVGAAKAHPRAPALLSRIEQARASVRSASMMGWVEPEVFSELTDATLEVLGEQGARDFWAARLGEAFARPLMRPLLLGGLGMHGKSPGAVMKMTPQSYWLTFRGCGEPSVDVETQRAVVTIRSMPPAFRTASVPTCFAGHALAAAREVGVPVQIDTDTAQLRTEGHVDILATW